MGATQSAAAQGDAQGDAQAGREAAPGPARALGDAPAQEEEEEEHAVREIMDDDGRPAGARGGEAAGLQGLHQRLGAGGDEEPRAEEGRGAERHRQVADLQADLETLAKRTREALANARGLASEIVQRVSTAQGGPTPTCAGRKRQQKRAAGVEDRFSALIEELEVLETRLTDLRTWLHEDGNAAYALHLAIAMQYIAAVMGTPVTDLRSRSRIGNERYHVEYDGVTAPQLLQELREDTFIMWYTEGNMRLLRSHMHGLNEVLDMVLRRSASEPDSFIMRVASGEASVAECDFCEVVQGLYDEERAMRSLRKFFKLLMITNAAVHEYYFETHHLSRFVSFVRGSLYYGVFKRNRGQHRGEVTFTGLGPSIEQNLKFIQYVWNLPDKGGIRHFYRSGISNVRHSVAFAISDTVKARFISSKKVGVLPAKFGVPSARSKAVPQRALVLHFHGGGFVSMSAAAHENYTRRWTKQCGVPVISVDYSLSPDAKFPTAVDEAFEAFRWCREVAGKVYGTDRVIVAGDSAGGTLCAAVIIKCIMEGYPGPDGALLAYPAVDIRRAFSPSILWSLNDKLLPYTFLLSCLSAYLGTTDPESMLKVCEDPLASPNCASDEILAQFPPTTVVAAARDPLFDKSVDFAERLSRLTPKGHARLVVVPGMVHGFLCFRVPVVGVPEVKHLIDFCGEELGKLIDFSPHQAPILPGRTDEKENKTLKCGVDKVSAGKLTAPSADSTEQEEKNVASDVASSAVEVVMLS